MIEAHLRDRCSPRIVVSPETERLETGGGIRNVLGRFAGSPFYAVNGDILWRDGKAPALNRLAAAWDSAVMDALLLLHPVSRAIGYDGQGDFLVHSGDRDGAVPIERRGMRQSAPYLFAGLQILHPRLFAGSPAGPFSLNITYDLAIARCRLFGIIHDGGWCHVGTPGDIAHATDFLVAGGEPRIPV
jgi:MurNAc alpha-1-phosphate uridylyltransferase